MTRRKLFSSPTVPVRRKLFSAETVETLYVIICRDCGYKVETADQTTKLLCPKCGGKRFNLLENGKEIMVDVPSLDQEEKVFSRRSLFNQSDEKMFSEKDDTDIERSLKLFSGQVINDSQIESNFGGLTGQDLIEKGFADIHGEKDYRIFDTAYLQAKLFSKLTISITKELDLDEVNKPKEDIISELADRGSLTPKGIMIIKKAHSIPQPEMNMFSDMEEWAKDSGIANDLRMEFGGQMLSMEEFDNLLLERYPDAISEEILGVLVEHKVILVQDNNVHILK